MAKTKPKVKATGITVQTPATLLQQVDRWRGAQNPIPTRAAVYRLALQAWLKNKRIKQ